jgi:hypothetical protein
MGAYLVEVLKRIDRTLKDRGEDALAAEELKLAAINRVFGFEILPAPFVVAHLQMGLLLQSLGAPMGANERAGVYLTNALTGWEPPKAPKTRLLFTELEEERDAAETAAERVAVEQGAWELGLTPELAFAHLGEQTCDVYLNSNAYWRNVPLKVWEYTIGGYQVIKKWLSYRERELLGRALTVDEVREVTNMARRIAAILLLEPQLDANYQAVKENYYDWQANL